MLTRYIYNIHSLQAVVLLVVEICLLYIKHNSNKPMVVESSGGIIHKAQSQAKRANYQIFLLLT